MKKIVQFIKGLYLIIKDWVVANGVTGIVFGIAAFYYLAKGNMLFAGIGFGVFGTRNWDWILGKLKLGWAWLKNKWENRKSKKVAPKRGRREK